MHLDQRVAAIDRHAPHRHHRRRPIIGGDAPVPATGSYPFAPPVDKRVLPGCLGYRALDELAGSGAAVRGEGGSPRPRPCTG